MTKLSILKNYINYAQNLPPPVLLKNVLRRAKRLFKEQHIRLRDKYKSSYIDKVDAKDLYRSFPRLDVKHLKPIIIWDTALICSGPVG
jgi:hypothetical protein